MTRTLDRAAATPELAAPAVAAAADDAAIAGTWTFAFVDLVGFTRLTERHGDAVAAAVAQRLHRAARRAARGGTRVVKTLGDGVLLVSASPAAMLRTLSALLREWHAEPAPLPARAGVHHGGAVPLPEAGDYVGSGVNVAARVTALAEPGEVLMTGAVAPAAAVAGFGVGPARRASLRGVAGRVDLYALR